MTEIRIGTTLLNTLEDPAEREFAALKGLRVAIVHYWFVSRGGGENVVEALAELFPQADIFALVANPRMLPESLRGRILHTSFLQKIPGARRFHRHFLLLYPLGLEHFDLSQYDLILSSESGPAKGVITSAKTCHICYCHSPMRYLWDMHAGYRASMSPFVRLIYSLASSWLRVWDLASSYRVDYFIANSQFVSSRIRKIYRRQSEVIHPPVKLAESFERGPGDYYLCAGRLVDYKRVDIAVQACNRLGRRLKVIGSGPQLEQLKRTAGPTITFLGHVSDKELHESYARCRALLHPGEEDFGIVPIEVQSYGRPVIAYGAGGALETVNGMWPDERLQPSHTGVFFKDQTVEDMARAILRFEGLETEFSPDTIASHAQKFGAERFRREMQSFILRRYREFQNAGASAAKNSQA